MLKNRLRNCTERGMISQGKEIYVGKEESVQDRDSCDKKMRVGH